MSDFLQRYDRYILLKQNGFSFIKKDEKGKWQHENITFPLSIELLENVSFFKDDCLKPVTVISNIHAPILIPKVLFDETAKEDYINLNYEIEEPIFIFNEKLEEYLLLHFIKESQKAILEQSCCPLQWLHLSGLLHKELRQSEFYDSNKSYFSLYADENSIDFIFEKEGKLQIMNRFEYTSSYDILYYILNIIKQFDVSTSDISLISYNLQDQEIILLLEQYIEQVFFY